MSFCLEFEKKDLLLHPSSRPGGGIGRRAGLKIQCPLKTCGFDSRPGYTKIERKPSWSKDEEGFSFVRENRYLCNTKGSREKLGGSSSKVLSSRVY